MDTVILEKLTGSHSQEIPNSEPKCVWSPEVWCVFTLSGVDKRDCLIMALKKCRSVLVIVCCVVLCCVLNSVHARSVFVTSSKCYSFEFISI